MPQRVNLHEAGLRQSPRLQELEANKSTKKARTCHLGHQSNPGYLFVHSVLTRYRCQNRHACI